MFLVIDCSNNVVTINSPILIWSLALLVLSAEAENEQVGSFKAKHSKFKYLKESNFVHDIGASIQHFTIFRFIQGKFIGIGRNIGFVLIFNFSWDSVYKMIPNMAW